METIGIFSVDTPRDCTDYGAINLGQSCPIATTDQEAEDNKFVANLVKGQIDAAVRPFSYHFSN